MYNPHHIFPTFVVIDKDSENQHWKVSKTDFKEIFPIFRIFHKKKVNKMKRTVKSQQIVIDS